jgi:dolichol-phosphate mannosyltransferase
MHRFLPTLVRWNGARVTEVPVRHRPRRHGTGKYGIGNRLFRALADLMAVRWMRKRWIDPRNHEETRP